MDVLTIDDRKLTAERVAASSQLANSPKLRSFFLYVVDCAIRDCPEEATEQQIGIHVFGRRPGYSSGDDSIVRSQARLLRQKLSAYYADEGAAEPLRIEMPKGHYLPLFRTRETQNHPHSSSFSSGSNDEGSSVRSSPLDPNAIPPDATSTKYRPTHDPTAIKTLPREVTHPESTDPDSAHPDSARIDAAYRGAPLPIIEARSFQRFKVRTLLIILLAVLTALAVGALLGRRWLPPKPRTSDPLWSAFLQKPKSTLVIYSNPLFQGDPTSGLHLISPEATAATNLATDETYTGTGEVGAVYQITRLFAQHDADFTLKRSRLVTWDEARSSNLIFIGAASQNIALHDLPGLTGFSIVLDQDHQGFIVNQHPQPGEPARFPYQDKTQETAIFASLPGLEPGTHILIFTGLTTIGTQAAVEFACRPENIAMLARQAGTTASEINPFEAVLQVGISKGVGVRARLLVLHRR